MSKFIKVIERATGTEYRAERIEGGFQVYATTGEAYKKLRESTFKKYFKPTGDTVTAEEVEESKAKKVEETKATNEKKQEKKAPKPKQKKGEQPVVELDSEKKEKMIEKIKKMFKLAENNPSQEEALSAALQAQKLMAKYNIHEEDVSLEEIKDDIDSVFTAQKHDSNLHSWRKQLAAIVAKNFRCKCYMHGKDVVFRGYTKDAEIALEVFMSLYTIGDKLASKAYGEQKERTGSGKGAYNSYIAGFLLGVDEGLNVQCTALMIIVPKEVEEEFKNFAADFKHSKATSLQVRDKELFDKGKSDGKEAVKSRGIEKKGK